MLHLVVIELITAPARFSMLTKTWNPPLARLIDTTLLFMSSSTPYGGMILVETPSHQRKKLNVILCTLLSAKVGLFDNRVASVVLVGLEVCHRSRPLGPSWNSVKPLLTSRYARAFRTASSCPYFKCCRVSRVTTLFRVTMALLWKADPTGVHQTNPVSYRMAKATRTTYGLSIFALLSPGPLDLPCLSRDTQNHGRQECEQTTIHPSLPRSLRLR